MPGFGQLEPFQIQKLWAFLLLADADRPVSATSPEEKFYSQLRKAAQWPPDVFCLAAAALKHSGAYTWLTSAEMAELQNEAREKGRLWREEIASPVAFDDTTYTLEIYGRLVAASLEISKFDGEEPGQQFPFVRFPMRHYAAMPGVMRYLALLLMQADYACQGFGLPSLPGSEWSMLRDKAELQLEPEEFGSTLCRAIHPSQARVLPKTHTPQSGRTLRSLSHNLCYAESDEGRPLWYTVPGCVSPTNRLNMLLVPHPETIESSCFKDRGPLQATDGTPEERGRHSSFVFQPADTCGQAVRHICNLVERAERMGAIPHVVVLPETSLSPPDYRLLRNYLLARRITLIVGLGGTTQEGVEENRLAVDIPISSTHAVHLRQKKHHPWRIHRDQILQYQLANELDPDRIYWEDLRVGDRNTYFVSLHPRILASVLVCEDLAQYEPVGRMIRAVGPHLVVALLLDGPQIGGRWPERYAAVLTDDPGSSVLSLTCAGMTRRSRLAPPAADRSRVVALWKDPARRREIELDPGSAAIVLTLTIEEQDEWTADWRRRSAVSLHLAQCLQVAGDDPRAPEASWFDHDRPRIEFLAPIEASALARLARLQVTIPPAEWAPYYGQIFARLGTQGRKIARQMISLLHDHYGPLDHPQSEDMGPEEKRQAEILARSGVSWGELPEGFAQERATAAEIVRWAAGLRNWK